MQTKVSIRNPPAFQEYAADMLANRRFRLMSLQERGLLMTMRYECWVNNYVPADARDLAKTLGLPEVEVLNALTSTVTHFFKEVDKNLNCIELDLYREKLLKNRQAMSEGGKNGGLTTQAKHRKNKATLEGTLKPLSRDEYSRDEKNKIESSGREVLKDKEREKWLEKYDEHS